MSSQRKPAVASQNISCFLRLSQVRQHEVLLYMIPGLALAEPSGPLCLTFALGCLENLIIIWRKFFFLLIGWDPTTWPAIKCLQIMVCSCAMSSNCGNETTLFFFLWSLLRGNGSFPKIFITKQTRWLEDKTILIELSYCKISWFVSVSQTNYLPKPNDWSAHHWQNKIFCSTSSNNR